MIAGQAAGLSLVLVDGSSMSTESLSVGNDGPGELRLTNGATLQTDLAELATREGAINRGEAFVREGSEWTTESLVVGFADTALLEVESGGTLTTTESAIVGVRDTASGTVNIRGADALWDAWDIDVRRGALNVEGGTVTVYIFGALTVGPEATLTLDEGTVSSRHMTVDGAFAFDAGRLEVRNYTGDLVNDTAGTFAPDRHTEPTRIDGTYTQANDATIEIEVNTASYADQVLADGASLGGTLVVLQHPDYVPAAGHLHEIIVTEQPLTGTFDDIQGLGAGAGLEMAVEYTDHAVRIVVRHVCAPGAVVRVDPTATGVGDGSSWDDAMTSLQDALENVADCPSLEEIWLAEGTYVPDDGDDRTASFDMVDGIAIYGGFPAGGGDGTFEARDPDLYPTILSGDIGVPDDDTDNSYHVVRIDATLTTTLDGVTISHGNADGTDDDASGGGVLLRQGHLTVNRCRFEGNRAADSGGGLSADLDTTLVATETSFVGNACASGRGGAMRLIDAASVLLRDCSFVANSAGAGVTGANDGGAIDILRTPVTAIDCLFENNVADAANGGTGGAIEQRGIRDGQLCTYVRCRFTGNAALSGGAVHVVNNAIASFVECLFDDNTATSQGGAVRVGGQPAHVTEAWFQNCTVAHNDAGEAGGGIYHRETIERLVIANSIAHGNTAGGLGGAEAQIDAENDVDLAEVDYTLVEGGWPTGTGNIDGDPRFAAPGAGNYRLRLGSPAVNAADDARVPDDTYDLDGDGDTDEALPLDLYDDPRFIDTVDMGVAELETCPQDIDGSGHVDVGDILAVLAAWGNEGGPEDVDESGTVDVGDLLDVLASWGPCP
jgi:T5SS/PEP-CTERM-associated repeat protein/predicted outer membrane repeat protein